MTKYYVRLDDACPAMHHEKWNRILSILEIHGIKPMIGIIPQNRDEETMITPPDSGFWDKVKEWDKKGYALALHGFDHICISDNGGINPVHKRSEFAGLPLDLQKNKIRQGYAVLNSHGIKPKYFFAPSHTFDRNTLRALEEETPIRIISDTVALFPYRRYGFAFIPQQMGKFRNIPLPGHWTFCYHPNTLTEEQIYHFERFISENKDKFGSYDDIDTKTLKGKRTADRILGWLFFFQRKIR